MRRRLVRRVRQDPGEGLVALTDRSCREAAHRRGPASSSSTSRWSCSHLPSALTALRERRRSDSARCDAARSATCVGLGSRAARDGRGVPRSVEQDRGGAHDARRVRSLESVHVVDHVRRPHEPRGRGAPTALSASHREETQWTGRAGGGLRSACRLRADAALRPPAARPSRCLSRQP
jgi:hypothetical protein